MARKLSIEQTMQENGAFNLFLTHDGQTPVDIAGDLGKYRSVKVFIEHFLKPEEQRHII